MSKKSDGSFKQKMSLLFGGSKHTVTVPHVEEVVLSQQVLRDLGSSGVLQNRLKILKDFGETVEAKRVEKHSIEALWLAVEDVLRLGPTEARHVVIGVLCTLVSSQYSQLGSMRHTFFQYVMNCHSEDIEPCFALLRSLTKDGSDITLIEETLGTYLLELLPKMVAGGNAIEILLFLKNMTEKNATYVDDAVINAVVRYCCPEKYSKHSNPPQSIEEIGATLNYVDIAVRYATIPVACTRRLAKYICSVRHAISNNNSLSKTVQQVMNMMICSKSLGNTIILTLCSFLEACPQQSFVPCKKIQQSAMFFLTKALWNKHRKKEEHYCTSTLPSFLRVLEKQDLEIAEEACLSLTYLITNHGLVLEHIAWEIILDIIHAIVNQGTHCFLAKQTNDDRMVHRLNELLNIAEELYLKRSDLTAVDKFFGLIEKCVVIRSEQSLVNLMTYKEPQIQPGAVAWRRNLLTFMEMFYSLANVSVVRSGAFERFCAVVEPYFELYEVELLEEVVLKVLHNVHTDHEPESRYLAVRFISKLAHRANYRHFYSLVDIIVKVVVACRSEEEGSKIVTDGLLPIFKYKVCHTPSCHAVYMFEKLVLLALSYYSEAGTVRTHSTSSIRYKIISALSNLSMSVSGTVTFRTEDRVHQCPFIRIANTQACLKPSNKSMLPAIAGEHPAMTDKFDVIDLPYNHINDLIFYCLDNEEDWEVLVLVLTHLKTLLCNAQLLIDSGADLSKLTSQLCNLASNPERMSSVRNVPHKLVSSDLQAHVFPVLVRLVPYLSSHLQMDCGRQLINSLTLGLKPKFAKCCIEGLTLATMEAPSLMVRTLQDIILTLSKITAGRLLAMTTLFFLSALAHQPILYKNFTEVDYKTVISVILPYTDPIKFEGYTIHFAHVVVCDWYVRCHYEHRMAFKEYILSNLRATIRSTSLGSFELRKPRSSSLTQSQVDRTKRSSTESKLTRPKSGDYGKGVGSPRGSVRSLLLTEKKQSEPSTILELEAVAAHRDLYSVTEDLLDRYLFSGRCNIIKKSQHQDVLFGEGNKCKNSKTWVVGDTLVTITTSKGCVENEGCQRCSMVKDVLGKKKPDLLLSDGLDAITPQNYPNLYLERHPVQSSPAPSISALITTRCNCWCKDWALVETRSATGNSSTVLRLQNKCHVVELDSMMGGDGHILTSLFDDDMTNLLLTEIQKQYHTKELQDMMANTTLSSSTSSGSKVSSSKHGSISRTRSNPDLDELMTPVARPRCNSTPNSLSLDPFDVIQAHRTQRGEAQQQDEQRGVIDSAFPTVEVYLARRETITEGMDFDGIGEIRATHELVERRRAEEVESSTMTRGSSVTSLSSRTEDLNEVEVRDSRSNSVLSDSMSLSECGNIMALTQESGHRRSIRSREPSTETSLDHPLRGYNSAASSRTNSPYSSPRPSLRNAAGTISNPTSPPISRCNSDWSSSNSLPRSSGKGAHRDIDPAFVFRQIYPTMALNAEGGPSGIPQNESLTRSLHLLDHMLVSNTHKIGVIYVAPGQTKEMQILKNTFGSIRYIDLVKKLGDCIWLRQCDQSTVYVGGLDTDEGNDGDYTISWRDKTTQVVFHIATMMPSIDTDPCGTNKKRHIGNNFVTIVYNDSGQPYIQGTIHGQCNNCDIIITPQSAAMNLVCVSSKPQPGSSAMKPHDDLLMSDGPLADIVRKMAINANVIRYTSSGAYSCNWLERLKRIRRIQDKAVTPMSSPTPSHRAPSDWSSR